MAHAPLRTYVLVNQDMVVHFAISNVHLASGRRTAKRTVIAEMAPIVIRSMENAYVHVAGRVKRVMKDVPPIVMGKIALKNAAAIMVVVVIIFLVNATVLPGTLDHSAWTFVLMENTAKNANPNAAVKTAVHAIPELESVFVLPAGWAQSARIDVPTETGVIIAQRSAIVIMARLAIIFLVTASVSQDLKAINVTRSVPRVNTARIAQVDATVEMGLHVIQLMADVNAVRDGGGDFVSKEHVPMDSMVRIAKRSVNVQKKIQNSVIPGTVSACANQAGVEKHVPDHVHY